MSTVGDNEAGEEGAIQCEEKNNTNNQTERNCVAQQEPSSSNNDTHNDTARQLSNDDDDNTTLQYNDEKADPNNASNTPSDVDTAADAVGNNDDAEMIKWDKEENIHDYLTYCNKKGMTGNHVPKPSTIWCVQHPCVLCAWIHNISVNANQHKYKVVTLMKMILTTKQHCHRNKK